MIVIVVGIGIGVVVFVFGVVFIVCVAMRTFASPYTTYRISPVDILEYCVYIEVGYWLIDCKGGHGIHAT
jgi:hypothetical protein